MFDRFFAAAAATFAALALSHPVSAQNNCLSPPSSLAAWWAGDDHALDLAGSNHGLLRSGAKFGEGKVGRSFEFDGQDDFVEARASWMNVRQGDFSIEGWCRTTAAKQWSTLLEFEGHNPALYIADAAGTLRLWPAAASTTGGFNDGQFHHFAVVRKDGVVSYYKDGAAIGTAPFAGDINAYRFFIGWDMAAGDGFNGSIDEVSVYTRALSESEVQAIHSAGSEGKCKPPALPPTSFFIDAEDFDFDGGQHHPQASQMPYAGGAYNGNSAVADIDYNDPGANESAVYRASSQGVGTTFQGDTYRDNYDVVADYKIGWCDPGDWQNYTRVFPLPARDYHIFARLASGALPSAIRLDQVVAGAKTTNQVLAKIGEAKGPATGSWGNFQYYPVLDDSSNPATIRLGGEATVRVTILPNSNEDLGFLQFVPVEPPATGPCVTLPSLAWWPGDGGALDISGTNHATLKNGAAFAPGKVGESFVFDGIDDYVETTLDVQPGAMPTSTWEMWIFPTRPGGRQQIASTDDGGYDRSLLVEGNSFGVFTGWGVWAPVSLSPNQWQHIAVVFSPTNVIFYKNGARFLYNFAPAGQGTGHKLQIGRNPSFGEYFQGRVDEVAVHSRELSAEEVQAIYRAGNAGKCKTGSPCGEISLLPTTLPDGQVGASYSQTLAASGGTAPYTFALASGSLPPPLTISAQGVISGLVAASGTNTFAIRVTDAQGCSGLRTLTIAVAEPPAVCANAPAGLVSWWRGEDSVQDSAGANTGSVRGGASFSAGFVGKAFQFDGVNGVAEVGTNSLHVGLGDFSIEGWLKTTATKSYSAIISFDAFRPGFYVRGDGRLGHYHSNIEDMRSTDAGFNDGQWHHFAVVRQNGFLSYYKDGRASGAETNRQYSAVINPSKVYIGGDTENVDYFPGSLDEISFYNRALTANEIQRIFAARSAGKCPGGPQECNVITMTSSLPVGVTQTDYNQTLTASGGTTPYFFAVVNGTLPAGLTLSTSGAISGRPTAVGSFQFVVRAADSNNCTASQSYTLAIEAAVAPVISISSSAMDFGTVPIGQIREQTLTIRNTGNAPLAISSVSSSARFTVAPTGSINISAGGQTNITVRFAPTAEGAQTDQLTINSNDPARPALQVSLSGTGQNRPATCVAPPFGLLGWWRGEGDNTDMLAGNNGSASSTIAHAPGMVGQAFAFNGSTAGLSIPADGLLHPRFLTLEAWIKFDSLQPPAGSALTPLIVKNFNTNNALQPSFALFKERASEQDRFVFKVATGSLENEVRSTTQIQPGTYYHIAATSDGNTARIYVNGAFEASANLAAPGAATPYDTNALFFGVDENGNRFQGQLDEVALYNRALSGNEILNLFNAGAAGKCLTGPALNIPAIGVTPSSLDFGTVRVGTTNRLSFTVRNRGAAVLNVSSVSTSNGRFIISPAGSFSLTNGMTREFEARFVPVFPDRQTGEISITSNDPNLFSFKIPVVGVAAMPTIVAETNTIAFGRVVIGEVKDSSVMIQNTGGWPLTLNEISVSGPYTITSGGDLGVIPPGGQRTIGLRFRPVSDFSQGGNLLIRSDDTRFSAMSIFLNGEGLLPEPRLQIDAAGDEVILSWSAARTNLVLESSRVLDPADWGAVTNPPQRADLTFSVRLPHSSRLRYFRLNSRPAPPQLETGLIAEPLHRPLDEQPVFPIIHSTQTAISAAAGGAVSLPDGARVEIPAGGLSRDAIVTFRKLDMSAYSYGVSRAVYQVETDGAVLTRPATLLLSYGTIPPGGTRAGIHVFHADQDIENVELPAVIDQPPGMARVTTDSFSEFVVEHEAPATKTWTSVKADPTSGRVLNVPYYAQGESLWCFAAASQMLFKYSGVDIEIWDVARHFGVSAIHGPKPLALYSGNYQKLFEDQGLKVRRHASWIFAPNFYQYLFEEIDAGRPVFVIVQYGIHAVVVVGYNSTGVYIHDPSGHSIKLVTGALNLNQLARVHLTWDQWRKALFAQGFLGAKVQFPLPVFTLALEDAERNPPLMTANLLSGVLDNGRVSREAFYAQRTSPETAKARFLWDGTEQLGYKFFPDEQFHTIHISNSDKLAMAVHLNNASVGQASATLRATLDGATVLSPTTITLEGRKTLHGVAVFPDERPYDLLTGAAGLLTPGWHNLRIELLTGSALIDSIPLRLLIAPAQPQKVRYLEVPGGMRLSWFPNPEESLSQIYYVVFANGVPLGSTEQKEFLAPNGTPQVKYTVVARERVNDLASPESEAAVKMEGIILQRSEEPSISGDVGVFSTLTPTSARIVGSKEETDLGSTVAVNWPAPPPLLLSSDNFDFTVISRMFGWPKGGDTYTISATPLMHYSNGSLRVGNGGYILITDGHRVQSIGRTQVFGTNTVEGGVLRSFEVELSKDFFFNFGEAVVRWNYTPLQ